jgi:hypothetical protein
VKGLIEGPFSHTTAAGLASLVIGEDPFETEKIWHKDVPLATSTADAGVWACTR